MDKQDILEVLYEVQEYLDDRADVIDGSEESGPLPNKAMSLGQRVDELVANIEKEVGR